MFVFGARIDRDGPLFDGRLKHAMGEASDDIEKVIAEVGVHKVQRWFSLFVKHPTGYYMSHLQADQFRDGWHIWDDDVIYGPWLAGVGSRNKTTRFKGYPHWVRATQELKDDAKDIAEFVVEQHLRRAG